MSRYHKIPKLYPVSRPSNTASPNGTEPNGRLGAWYLRGRRVRRAAVRFNR